MCESKVYRMEGSTKKIVMDDVTVINVEGDSLNLSNVLGETKKVKGKLLKVDSERHEIHIR